MAGAVATPESEGLADTETVLVLAPDGPRSEHACESLLHAAGEARALHVAFGPTPDECVARWRGAAATPPEIDVVAVGDGSRSAGDADGVSAGGLSIDPVADPADLTGIGIEVTDALERWNGPIVVCVDSLSAMLEHVSVERAFRFLNDVTVRLKDVDADAHVHLDPGYHDEGTINALAGLFDAVLEVDGDGTRTVRTR